MRAQTYRHVVSPADPAAQGSADPATLDPVPPFPLGDASFEQRPREEDGCQQQAAEDVGKADGPPPQEFEGLRQRPVVFADDQPGDDESARDA